MALMCCQLNGNGAEKCIKNAFIFFVSKLFKIKTYFQNLF